MWFSFHDYLKKSSIPRGRPPIFSPFPLYPAHACKIWSCLQNPNISFSIPKWPPLSPTNIKCFPHCFTHRNHAAHHAPSPRHTLQVPSSAPGPTWQTSLHCATPSVLNCLLFLSPHPNLTHSSRPAEWSSPYVNFPALCSEMLIYFCIHSYLHNVCLLGECY